MIHIDNVSVTTLPTGNRHFACRGDFNGSSPCRVDVLPFVILVTAAGKWIASTTDTTLESSEDRPNRRYHAARPQERFVHSHLTLELFSLCFQGCERRRAIHWSRRSALAMRDRRIFIDA